MFQCLAPRSTRTAHLMIDGQLARLSLPNHSPAQPWFKSTQKLPSAILVMQGETAERSGFGLYSPIESDYPNPEYLRKGGYVQSEIVLDLPSTLYNGSPNGR